MKRTRGILFSAWLCLPFVLIAVACISDSAQAFTPGKTYDQSNWEEIQDLLVPSVLNWVKKGEWSLKTGEFDYEWEMADAFRKASLANEGKYAVDEDGILIEKETGKPPAFVYGFPFPTVDPKDPGAGERIMENNTALRLHFTGFYANSSVKWINEKSLEREVVAGMDLLFYLQRLGGPIPNPNNFQMQHMTFVMEPFDLRGTVQMSWIYNDNREDTVMAYLPMLRRVRRMTSASRSDPFLGSDFCNDDAYLWAGKDASMKWRYVGEKTVLAPFTTLEKMVQKDNPDGSVPKTLPPVEKGYEVSGWQGIAWAPVSLVFAPRSCWIVEAIPKNQYYNYGRIIFYVDKFNYQLYYKVIYDRSGEYWKTLMLAHSYQISENGIDLMGAGDFYMAVDDKTHHATAADIIQRKDRPMILYLPLSKIGPQDFSRSKLIQCSK